MNVVELREVLDGELIDAPMLTIAEKYQHSLALTNALAERWGKSPIEDDAWDQTTDNYLSYLMDNFPTELVLHAVHTAYREHGIGFNVGTEIGKRFYEEYHARILSGYQGLIKASLSD